MWWDILNNLKLSHIIIPIIIFILVIMGIIQLIKWIF